MDLKLEVSVSADWDDCRHDDIREFFGGDCSGQPTAWVEEEGNVAFTLTLKGDSAEVDWCEIDEIRARYGYNVYSATGQTDAGRYLIIVFVYKKDHRALILSTRDMTDSERRRHGKK